MKAEKRHELEKNELADWLGEHIEAVKPYAPTIGIVVVGGVCAILLAIYLAGSGGTASARAWSAYFTAASEPLPELPLEAVVKDIPGTPAALWALLTVGDINLEEGARLMFSDREAAKKELEKAEQALTRVEAEANDPVLKTRAKLSLGKVYESLCQPEKARKYYEEVAAAEKDSAIGKLAERSARRMADPREVALLAWFAEQKPRRPSPGFGPGGLPGLPNDLPERPDLSLPGLGQPTAGTGSGASGTGPSGVGAGIGSGLDLENFGTGKPAEPGLAFPEPGETKPGETKPGETKPGETKPGETKPGDVKPEATAPGAADPAPPAEPENKPE